MNIKIYSKKHGVKTLIISRADYDNLPKKAIYLSKGKYTFYAAIERKLVHRLIMNPSSHQLVDHKDGNGLNCLRSNMRICNHFENARNVRIQKTSSSGYKGVFYQRGAYYVQIMADYKSIYGGRFKSKIRAAKRYNELAIKHHGEFARLNPV